MIQIAVDISSGFQKIKDYLQRNNITQKQFVIELIENEIERDLEQRQATSGITGNSERMTENVVKHENAATVSDFESETEESENSDEGEELDKDQEESENVRFFMGM